MELTRLLATRAARQALCSHACVLRRASLVRASACRVGALALRPAAADGALWEALFIAADRARSVGQPVHARAGRERGAAELLAGAASKHCLLRKEGTLRLLNVIIIYVFLGIQG